MADAVLDHDGNPATQLMVDTFDRIGVIHRKRVKTAADVQQRYVAFDQPIEFHEAFARDQRIVGIDAGNMVGVHRGPVEGVATATAHSDQRRLVGKSMFFGDEFKPRLPIFHVVGLNKSDVVTALQQSDLRL